MTIYCCISCGAALSGFHPCDHCGEIKIERKQYGQPSYVLDYLACLVIVRHFTGREPEAVHTYEMDQPHGKIEVMT